MTTLPMVGTLLVWSALAAVIAAVAAYLYSLTQPSSASDGEKRLGPVGQRVGRAAFLLAAALVLGIAAVHLDLLLTHRFDINYVYNFSARELPPLYLFATFWAGQEGSFLLWAVWTVLIGSVLAFTAGRTYEPRVMSVYGGVLVFLLVLLTVKSPFAPLPPGSGVPADGMGLNPLLENPWMVVHPPTLFLGFSALAVPFAYAIASLIWDDASRWTRRAWPWALFGFAVLGFGIMLGGYWAYETLGWGGFWAWDPVENGPLVPWLGLTAFLHSVLTTRARGSLKKTTVFLAMAPFVLALYETFLTRTGILGKASVHSFSTLGGTANAILLYVLLGVTAVSLGLLAWRGRTLKNESSATENSTSRDFGMTLAITLLLVCAVITGVGMSAPLITQIGMSLHIVQHQSSVPSSFYNKANFPIAVLLMIGMAVGPYLTWRQTEGKSLEPMVWLYVGAVAIAIGFVVLSRDVLHVNAAIPLIVLLAACVLCIVANAALLARRHRSDAPALAGLTAGMRTAGGAVAHIGAALLLLGVVFLVSWYRESDQILVQGQPRPVDSFPMTLDIAGNTSNVNDPGNKLRLSVQEGDGAAQTRYMAYMPIAMRSNEGLMQIVARPVIAHRWWGDVYISLKDGPEPLSPSPLLKQTLQEGQSVVYNGYKISVENFSVDPVEGAMARQGVMPDKLETTIPLIVTPPGGQPVEVDARYIRYANNPLGDTSPEVKLPLGPDKLPWSLAVTGMRLAAGEPGTADFYMRDSGVPLVTAYVVNVSTRPMIGLVWFGTILIALGGLLSMRRRILENRASIIPEIGEPETTGEDLGILARPSGVSVYDTGDEPALAKSEN